MDYKKTLGLRIAELRKKRRLTQAELAIQIDVTIKYVSKLETGKATPKLDTLNKMAEALDCQIKDFFDTGHFRSEQRLILLINQKLKSASLNILQLIYKMLEELD